jgi:tetratricopeptide (TPR) repeat protein
MQRVKGHVGKWALIVAFQLLYGLLIFAVTRDLYKTEDTYKTGESYKIESPGKSAAVTKQRTVDIPGSSKFTVTDAERLVAPAATGGPARPAENAEELARIADEHFRQKRFDQAASLYQRVVDLAPHNVGVYNNLGLTLHYIGRSEDAIERLEQGIAVDGEHQRIWLTLGFVRAQTGDTDAAKKALQRAVDLAPDSSVATEATRMMAALR